MSNRARLVPALVALLTVVAAAFLWWQSERSQSLLREQVLLQAEKRSVHLADAMGGQVSGLITTLDLQLRDLRHEWVRDPGAFNEVARGVIEALPRGFISHISVANADGHVIYDTLEKQGAMFIGDQAHFQAQRDAAADDRLVIGKPVKSRIAEDWLVVVNRPILLGGRFLGSVQMMVSTAFIARRLGALQLSSQDVVTLISPDGTFLARSRDHEEAMGTSVPAHRPFLTDPDARSGSFRTEGLVDGIARTYGWYRLRTSGLVVAIGIADQAVLAPLAPALESSRQVSAALITLLLVSGGLIIALLVYLGRKASALETSEARLKEAQRLARVGSWKRELTTHQLSWSDEIFRIFEVDATVKPNYKTFITSVHPDDRALVSESYVRSVDARKTYDLVHRLLMADGRIKHVRVSGFTEFDGDLPVRSVGTVQDITEVHTAQEALKRLNEELEQRVDERTRELSVLNRELEAFAYSVSHDLRTPLRSIEGFASLLAEDSGAVLTEDARTYVNRIRTSSRRMGRLISDLLTLAHLSRAELRLEPVNLTRMAQSIAKELASTDPGRSVQWHIDEDMQVIADPGLMRVVLQNLLGNAWKYTGQTLEAVVAFTHTRRGDGAVEFCVRDNGAGFDMAYADQLFEPFKRLHAHHEFEGSGVGLATVRRVIERHGGQVSGEGTVGRGAAFCFSVPAA